MDKKTIITLGSLLVVILCIAFCVWLIMKHSNSMTSISFEELYNDGDISIMGIHQYTTKAEFEEMIEMSYSEYLTKMDDAKINDQLDPYMFLLEGMPAVCLVRFEDENKRNLILYFINEDELSPKEWVHHTDLLIEKLKSVSTHTNYWTYTQPNATVRLELPAVTVDGQETASRASEMWITFTGEKGT